MPSGVRDIQLLELKDTISQLNNTISTQNELIRSLQKMLQERDAKDSEKDQLIANLQAQLDYLKTRLFGSTSEIRHEQLPGQLDLFHLQTEDEPEPVPLEVEYIEVKAHKKARKSKAAYDEVFADLPTENVYVDTLTEEQKTCDVCGTMMIPIGHELIRTELRYTEPKLERIDYYATTYECPQCKETEDPRFIKDEGTPALIPGSYASSGLAAHVMYYKYVMSMPLYRQEQQSAGGTALLLLGSHTTLLAAGNTQRPRKDYTHPADQGFLYCNKLFEYERSYREKGLSPKQIYNRRLKDQKPVIEDFLLWLDQLHPESGDRLIKAINYSNGCRPFMMNYLKDGACSLSNNLSENSIRPLVVGRKNWLFCDTPAGADASMKIYSMIETAKANELDPLKYLSFLLEHRPGAEMSDEELEQFAPWSKLAQETCK